MPKITKLETFSNEFVGFVKLTTDAGQVGWGQTSTYNSDITATIFHRHVAVGGRLLSEGGAFAPYFHFLVLEGRPLDECQRLLTGFTDLVVELLGAERALVRGGCWPIPPRYWAIGGTPASVIRTAEIAARAETDRPA